MRLDRSAVFAIRLCTSNTECLVKVTLQFIWTLVWGETCSEDIRPSLPLYCGCHTFDTGRANHKCLRLSSSSCFRDLAAIARRFTPLRTTVVQVMPLKHLFQSRLTACTHPRCLRDLTHNHVCLNFFFKSPKHQSGANFVCPVSINNTRVSSLRPLCTLHIRYHIMLHSHFALHSCRGGDTGASRRWKNWSRSGATER